MGLFGKTNKADYTTSNFRMRLISLSSRASDEFALGAEEAVRSARQEARIYGDSPGTRRRIAQAEQVRDRWNKHDPVRKANRGK